jgi:hypothetical protein
MEEFTKFKEFNILGDKVNILCTETDYGVSAIAEINDENIYHIGLLQEHKESGRIASEVNDVLNIFLAVVSWEGFFNKKISKDSYSKIIDENNGEDTFLSKIDII